MAILSEVSALCSVIMSDDSAFHTNLWEPGCKNRIVDICTRSNAGQTISTADIAFLYRMKDGGYTDADCASTSQTVDESTGISPVAIGLIVLAIIGAYFILSD